jgi:hypothetical protein
MDIHEKELSKACWDYSSVAGEHYRFAEVKSGFVTQKRICFPENSKRRMSLKALQGQYSLMDMTVKGTGNSYLIVGWETVPSLVYSFEGISL